MNGQRGSALPDFPAPATDDCPRMFRFFEKQIDIYPAGEPATPPRTLFAFLLHFSRPLVPWLLLMSLLTGTISALEIVFFDFMGDLVDWLGKADRATFFAVHGQTLLGMAALVVVVFPLLVMACYYNGSAARAVLANPVAFHLGLISYSIYLWHPLVRDVFARGMSIAHKHGVTGYDLAFVLGVYLVTWLVCWASYLLIEVPGHRAIKKLERRVVPPPPLPFRQAAE